MVQDLLNVDQLEQKIADEARKSGDEYYSKPLPWLRVGDYVEIGLRRACVVTELKLIKGAKHAVHGNKKRIVGVDVLSGERRERELYERFRVSVPFVEKREYSLINVTLEGACTLLDEVTSEQGDLPLPGGGSALSLSLSLSPGDLSAGIRAAFDDTDDVVVTVVSAWGDQAITEFRKKSDQN